MKTHSSEACQGRACVIHSPSDHHMRDWPIVHRLDRQVELDGWDELGDAVLPGPVYTLTERTCPHGVGHPDPDSLRHAQRVGGRAFRQEQSVHGCDGCCRKPEPESQHNPSYVDDDDWVMTEPRHALPDDDPRVVEMRERFFAALEAHDQGEAGGGSE